MKNIKQFVKTAKILSACSMVLALAVPAFADNGAGQTVMPIMRMDIGPRQLAMAGAATAVANDDLFGMRYNPAGLAYMKELQIAGMYQDGVLDTNMQYFGIGMPLPFNGFVGSHRPSLAVTVLLSDNGDFDVNLLNSDGSLFSNDWKKSAGSDFAVALSYAECIYDGVFNIGYGRMRVLHSFGLTAKFMSSKLPSKNSSNFVSEETGTAFGGDFGYQLNLPDAGLSLGLSILNVASKMKYLDDEFNLPMTFRAGLGYTMDIGKNLKATAAVDYVNYIKDEENRVFAGVELEFLQYVSLRGGYRFNQDWYNWTMGVGLKVWDFEFDAAFQPDSDIENLFQISLTWKFPVISLRDEDTPGTPASRSLSPAERSARDNAQQQERRRPSTEYQPSSPSTRQEKIQPANTKGKDSNLLLF